jgi:hypothetical protein
LDTNMHDRNTINPEWIPIKTLTQNEEGSGYM